MMVGHHHGMIFVSGTTRRQSEACIGTAKATIQRVGEVKHTLPLTSKIATVFSALIAPTRETWAAKEAYLDSP